MSRKFLIFLTSVLYSSYCFGSNDMEGYDDDQIACLSSNGSVYVSLNEYPFIGMEEAQALGYPLVPSVYGDDLEKSFNWNDQKNFVADLKLGLLERNIVKEVTNSPEFNQLILVIYFEATEQNSDESQYRLDVVSLIRFDGEAVTESYYLTHSYGSSTPVNYLAEKKIVSDLLLQKIIDDVFSFICKAGN
mgnify:CR=1 FL=1